MPIPALPEGHQMTLDSYRPSLRHPRTGAKILPVGYTASGRAVWPLIGADESHDREALLARVNDLSARLEADATALTVEELAELRAFVVSEATNDDGTDTSPETLDHLRMVATLNERVGAEEGVRATAAQAAADEAAALREGLRAVAAPAEPAAPEGQAPAADPAADPAATADTADPAAEAQPQGEPELVTAGGTRPRPVAFSRVSQRRTPEREAPAAGNASEGRVEASLVASGGGRIERTDEGIAMLTDRLNAGLDALRAGSRREIVASAVSELPHRIETGQSPDINRAAMDAAVRDQLAAGGGICRPVTIDYNIPTWVNIEEPVKAGLPSIDAPRGGLQYAMPVAFDASVYGAGVSIWTETNDRTPGHVGDTGPLGLGGVGTGPTVKPCVEIDCDTFVEVDVEAITQCATIGNMRARFSPENVEKLMSYLQMAFVNVAEVERLRQMRRAAKHVTATQEFGAVRDLLNFFDRLRAYYRSVYRLSDNVVLRVALESYVREIIRIDLRKAAFPYEGDTGNSLMVTDAQIDGYLASVGIVPLWVLDDDTGDQTFAKATAGTAGSPSTFPAFPAGTLAGSIRVRALAYPEGSYQRLDGGELNLGVVRDSALNSVNKFQVFSEIFEAVAFRGFESVDFRIDVKANGATAGTIAPSPA